ncbi:PREDICTED: F-box/kelch-repeat protein At3g06240-like [Fragaria vesca subsp. vesca]
MSKKQRFDVPEDVVVMILMRLPVKSLIRFTCVSKQWRSIIISDPKFAKHQFELASQQRTLCRRFLISSYRTLETPNPFDDDIPRLPSRFQSLGDSFNAASVKNLTFPSEENLQRAMASCNGLVLLGRSYYSCYEELSIWNPSTGFLRKIPSPSFGSGKKKPDRRMFANYGFGHVSATDDYILVFVVPSLADAYQGCVEVHVFSLTANSWKVISAPNSSCHGWVGGQGSLSNGAFHWVNFRNRRMSDPAIYAFDLVMEEFRQVPLPRLIQNNVKCVGQLTMVLFGGCLCLQFRKSYQCSEIWAMREYGVPESWVKLFEFSTYDLPDVFPSMRSFDPYCVMEGGKLVIKLFDKELVMIQCGKEEKPVCCGRYRLEAVPGCDFQFTVTGYVETLISVPK